MSLSTDSRQQPPRSIDMNSSSSTPAATSTSASKTAAAARDAQIVKPNAPPVFTGSAQLAPVRSAEVGTQESMLAAAPDDGDDDDHVPARVLTRKSEHYSADSKGDSDEEAGAVDAGYATMEFPDGGLKAWSVVLGCWLFAASQLSFGMLWGALLSELSTGAQKDTSLGTLNLIQGLTNFVANAGGFVTGRMGDVFGYKPMIAIGAVGFCLSIVACAFSSHNLALLFVFQGFFIGITMAMGYPLFMSLPSMWFLKRRGFATGIAVSGTGFGGAVGSLIIRSLLPKLGWRNTLLVYAGINVVISCIAFSLIEVRLPPLRPGQKRVASKAWLPKGVWSDPAFYSVSAAVFLGIFGYLVPFSFLVTYTQAKVPSLSPTSIMPAVPLILANTASGFGRIASGFLADKAGPVNMLFVSFFFGGIIQLVGWPFAESLGGIIAFAMTYGFTAAWFVSLTAPAGAQLFGLRGLSTLVGFLVLCNSVGQGLGATIAGWILDAVNNDYRLVAYYSGGVMLAGALLLLPARFIRERRVFARF